VWLADRVLDVNEGVPGDTVLEAEIDESCIRGYEWVEEGKTYREFLAPAAVVNAHATVRILAPDQIPERPWLQPEQEP
jgi:hypothetical protein